MRGGTSPGARDVSSPTRRRAIGGGHVSTGIGVLTIRIPGAGAVVMGWAVVVAVAVVPARPVTVGEVLAERPAVLCVRHVALRS